MPPFRGERERTLSNMRTKFLASMVVLALVGSQLTAQTVIVDRPPDPSLLGGGIIGGFFTDRPDEVVSTLTEVTFPSSVTIGSVTVFTTNLNDAIPGVGYPIGGQSTAILNIFEGSTLSNSDSTTSGGDFGLPGATVDYVATADGIEITVSQLDITLAAGTYLIGITPVLDFGTNGQEFFLDAGSNGETTFLNNPGGAFFIPIFGMATINANMLDLPTPYTGQSIRIASASDVIKGDVNMDGVVNLLDVGPFVDAVSTGTFIAEADVDCNGVVNLLDVGPFVDLLTGN